MFDLDSLFLGSLRQCVRDDGSIIDFLAHLGLGADFACYCGELDRALTAAVKTVETTNPEGALVALQTYFRTLPDGAHELPRQRVAILIAMAANRAALVPVLTEEHVADIEGRVRQI